MTILRSADRLMLPAVQETLRALKLEDEDFAAARLAVLYAETIDNCASKDWAMRWLAPLLQSCLETLNATPAARVRLKDEKPHVTGSGLARLRAAHSA